MLHSLVLMTFSCTLTMKLWACFEFKVLEKCLATCLRSLDFGFTNLVFLTKVDAYRCLISTTYINRLFGKDFPSIYHKKKTNQEIQKPKIKTLSRSGKIKKQLESIYLPKLKTQTVREKNLNDQCSKERKKEKRRYL